MGRRPRRRSSTARRRSAATPGITLIPEPSIPGDATLNVNVFTPVPGRPGRRAARCSSTSTAAATSAGSPASPWYDGRAFNRDGVVTVTVSYRLGFDGFGHIAGAPSNRGVRDWLAALEWVRDNIAAFGGDPARVTIAGQSAGGGAVLTLLGMPAAQHLFHAVWALSGAARRRRPERARTLSAKLANLAGRRADPRRLRVGARGAAARAAGEGGVARLDGNPLAGVARAPRGRPARGVR